MVLDIDVTRDEIHFGASLTVRFLRSRPAAESRKGDELAVDTESYPIYRLDELPCQAPALSDGVLIPLHPHEVLQISFSGRWWKPNAVIVAVGDHNIISGKPWDGGLSADPQNYLVCPEQERLDGLDLRECLDRRALAADQSCPAETQPDGAGWHQRLRLVVYEPRPGLFPDRRRRVPRPEENMRGSSHLDKHRSTLAGKEPFQIRPDPHGIATWDQDDCRSIDVYIIERAKFEILTGIRPPCISTDHIR